MSESPTLPEHGASGKSAGLLAKLGLVLAATMAGLVVVEIALRQLDLPNNEFDFLNAEQTSLEEFQFDEELFWSLREDAPRFRVNSKGLRGFWPDGPKEDNELRIACIGDSCTFGTGVRYEESYGMQLEQILARRNPNLAVTSVLAALPGYSSYQSVRLFNRHVKGYEPDWTIIYCGAWNDYVSAMGASDKQRGEEYGGLNLVRLIEQVFEAPRASRAEYLKGMETGEYLEGPRVELDDFVRNLEALIDGASQTGRTILIVPPIPKSTLEQYRGGQPYREAIRELAERRDTLLMDGERGFSQALAKLGEDWRVDLQTGLPIYFSDWIHPSAAGHSMIAEVLSLLIFLEQETASKAIRRKTVEIEPLGSTSALNSKPIIVAGDDLDETERVWIGDSWIRDFEQLPDGTLRLRPAQPLVPGTQDLHFRTPRGSRWGSETLEVLSHPLTASLESEDGHLTMRATVEGPVGWSVGLWLSHALRDKPAATRFGAFHLVSDPDGRPAGNDELPFRFERLPFGTTGTFGADGVCELELKLEVDLGSIEFLYLQGGILDANSSSIGAVTEVLKLPVRKSN